MPQRSCAATFMRGGTSKGVFFLSGDLPADQGARDAFLLKVLGSPDPNGRQLDGMGGGISSLSKTIIVTPSAREGVDIEYLHGQVAVDAPMIDYAANCGNLSAATGVFALEAGLVSLPDGEANVRMLNLNTDKRVDCRFRIRDGAAETEGACEIAGVAGSGAPIELDFLEPGGAATGALLPTGRPVDELRLPDGTTIAASIVDAACLSVFVRAADLGRSGTELPSVLRAKVELMQRLEAIRCAAAVMAGVVENPHDATRHSPSAPRVAMVAPAADAPTLSGAGVKAGECDIHVRMLSMGAPHLAVPLTGAMCTGVAAQVAGTLVQECATPASDDGKLRIAHGSGVVPVAASVSLRTEGWFAERASVFRTARTLMRGEVFVPDSAPDSA